MIPHTPEQPPITPVTDNRVIPRGIIPRSTKTWLLGGGALGLAAIVVLFGGSSTVKEQAKAALTPPATPADPQRLQYYEQQLRQAPVAAPVQPLGAVTTTAYDPRQAHQPAPYVDMPQGYSQPQGKPADPIAEDRKRRDYESLFSSNVVSSKRPANETLAANVAWPQPVQPAPLDDIARSVLRAMGPQGGQPPSAPLGQEAAPPPPLGQPVVAAKSATPASGLHRVYEGTVIDAILANRLDGGGIAPVNALITNDVWSTDHLALVIPAGARVLGTASPVQGFGQSRLAVAFHRVVGPHGLDISLDQFVGLNIAGDAGLKDQVNNHYLSIFGAAAAVGMISGLSQAVGGTFGRDNTTIVMGGAGDATAQAASQTMQRFINQMPTVTIREGHRLKVYLTSDLDLPTYGDAQ